MLSNLRIDHLAWWKSYPLGSKQSPSSSSHHMTLPVRVVALSWEERLCPFTGTASRSQSASSKVNWCHCGVLCRASVFPMGNWSPFAFCSFPDTASVKCKRSRCPAESSSSPWSMPMLLTLSSGTAWLPAQRPTPCIAVWQKCTPSTAVTQCTRRWLLKRTETSARHWCHSSASTTNLATVSSFDGMEGEVWKEAFDDRHVTLSLAGCWVRPLKASMWFLATGSLSVARLALISQEQKNSFYISELFLSPNDRRPDFSLKRRK